ncbi:MAG: hypothetical protein ACKO2G_16365 [Verrucomicrobiales bacterium]
MRRVLARGSVLIEAAAGIALIGVVAMMLLRSSINALSGRYWTIMQNMSDSYMGYEVALAQRVPMDEVVGNSSLWPRNPTRTTSTVTVGKLPGGGAVTATLHRTRLPHPNNLPAAGGTGTAVSNPARMEVWKLQSHLVYKMGSATCRKSRTVVRVR